MTVVGIAQGTDTGAAVPARPLMLLIAAAGIAAAAISVALALTSDHQASPEVQGALMAWITLSYVFAGLVAWWRRPRQPPRAADDRRGLRRLPLEPDVGELRRSRSRSGSRSTSARRCCSCTSAWRSRAAPGRAVGARPRRGRLLHRGRGAARRHGPRRVRARQPAGARRRRRTRHTRCCACSCWCSAPSAGRHRLPRRAAPALGRAAAAVAGVAGRLVRARAADARVPVHDGGARPGERPGGVRDDPEADAVRGRPRADRVPGRSARRPARPFGGR